MSQLKPYEGPNAEELVEQMRRDLGPDAKIVRGETLRVGGVLGFFSKEQLRLYAEVPEPAEVPEQTAGRRHAKMPGHAETPRRVPDPVATDIFATLAEETADRNDVTSTPAARRVTARGDPPAPTPASAPAPVKPGPPRPAEPVDFDAVFRDVARGIEDEPTPNAAESAGLHFRRNGHVPTPAVSVTPPAPATRPPVAPAPATPIERPPLPAGGSHPEPARDDGLAGALWATGLRRADAAAVAERVKEGIDLSVVLTQLFVRLAPPLPPLRPDPPRRLVIVGSAAQAGPLAVDLAWECDVNPDAIAYVDATSAQHSGRAVIVALDAPLTTRHLARQYRAITALGPATVVGVVDAAVKPKDILAWADGLGGIDALALVGVTATQSPAAVLQIGIPVARLDGYTASPARWAATVVDLIEAHR